MAGEDQVTERVPGGVELAGEQAVEDGQAGHFRGVDAGGQPPVAGEPAEVDREDRPQHEGEEEDGDADADQRAGDGGHVEPAAAPLGGEVAERHADGDREDDGHQRQLDGGGESQEELVHDRLAGLGGRAEVALDQPLDEAAVLHVHRLVEPQSPVDTCHLGLGRFLSENRRGGSAGQPVQPDEEQNRQAEQGGYELKQSSYDETQHPAMPLSCVVRGAPVFGPGRGRARGGWWEGGARW